MHIYENHAAMVVTPAINLRRDLDKIRIMRENHGSEGSGLSQLSFVNYPDVLLIIRRRRHHPPSAQSLGDPHVHVLIGVDF
jgi:hypothetical protein